MHFYIHLKHTSSYECLKLYNQKESYREFVVDIILCSAPVLYSIIVLASNPVFLIPLQWKLYYSDLMSSWHPLCSKRELRKSHIFSCLIFCIKKLLFNTTSFECKIGRVLWVFLFCQTQKLVVLEICQEFLLCWDQS